MKKNIIIGLFLLMANCALAQTDREFWFVAPEVTWGHPGSGGGGEPIYLKLSSLNLPSTVTIEQPANAAFFAPITVNLGANQTQVVDLTPRIAFIENDPPDKVNNYGIHITATELITAYYEEAEQYNNDIFALKGKNALGTLFYIPMQNYFNNGSYTPTPYSKIDIVATVDNTEIWITPTQNVFKTPATFYPANVPYKIILNKGQTYCVRANGTTAAAHLGGTKVTSNQPIAITVSDDSMAADPHGGCRDINGDQIVPVDIIGKEYIFMSTGGALLNDGMDRGFIIGTEDNTHDTIHGLDTFVLNEQEVYGFEILDGQFYRVTSDKKVYCYHIGGQQGCEVGGAILPPIDACTGSTQVGFTRSLDFPFSLIIMVRKGAEDGFILNGDGPNTIIPSTGFTAIPGSDWSYGKFSFGTAVIPLNTASLIQNTKDLFHLGVVNGNSGTGGMYGYFSDFNELEVNARIASTGSGVIKSCFNDSVQLIASGGTTYHWFSNYPPGTVFDNDTIATPKVLVLKPDTTVDIFVEVSGACDMTDIAQVRIIVADSIITNFSIDTSCHCSPYHFEFTNLTYPSSSLKYWWDFGNGNIYYTTLDTAVMQHFADSTIVSPDTFFVNLRARNTFRCEDDTVIPLVVFPEVTALFSPLHSVGCHPDTILFTNLSDSIHWQEWSFGDGSATSNDTNPTHIFKNFTTHDTTYTIKLKVKSQYNCEDSTTGSVTVYPYIQAGFTVDPAISCSPYKARFYNNSQNQGAIVTYYWDVNGDYVDDNILVPGVDIVDSLDVTYVNNSAVPINYRVRLIVENAAGCQDSIIRFITVYPLVTASFNSDNDVCDSTVVTFTNTSTHADSLFWYYGDGASGSDFSHLYRNFTSVNQDYNVRLIAYSQYFCYDTAEAVVRVHPFVRAGFNVAPFAACQPYNVLLNNSSQNRSAITRYDWTAPSFTQTLFADFDTISHIFYNNSLINDSTISITLRVQNDDPTCFHEYMDSVKVYKKVNAKIATPAPVSDTIKGCHPFTVHFTPEFSGSDYYYWSFGDGASSDSTTVYHTFENFTATSRTYKVILQATSDHDCKGYDSVYVMVHPYMQAKFTLQPAIVCDGQPVTFANASFNPNAIGTYILDYGDGTPADTINSFDSISHTYYNSSTTNNTEYYPTLTVINQYSNACTDTFMDTVYVRKRVNASFDVSDSTICHNTSITFTNNSPHAAGNNYLWIFGDSTSYNAGSSTADITHIYTNFTADSVNYAARLMVTTAEFCRDSSDAINITVYPYIDAKFTKPASAGCQPFAAIFQNACPNQGAISQYNWSFGDGYTLQHQFDSAWLHHTYFNRDSLNLKDSTLMVTLTVENDWGCPKSFTDSIMVYHYLNAKFHPRDSIGCHPFTVPFDNTSIGTVQYHWDFGDTNTSSVFEPVHQFKNYVADSLDKVVELIAYSEHFCSDTARGTITILPRVEAYFTLSAVTGCTPLDIEFSNGSTGADICEWDWNNDGSIDTITYGQGLFSHIFVNNGTSPLYDTIVLYVSNTEGCRDTLQRIITVYPYIPPVILVQNEVSHQYQLLHNADTAGCHPFRLSFRTNPIPGVTYQWEFNNGNASQLVQPPVQYFYDTSSYVSQQYHVTLRTLSGYNCTKTDTVQIMVNPKPLAGFNTIAPGCAPYPAAFINTSQINTTAQDSIVWHFGDGDTLQVFNLNPIQHIYTNTSIAPFDTMNAVLYLQNSYGCRDTASQQIVVYPTVDADFILQNHSPYVDCSPLTDVIKTRCSPWAYKFSWVLDNNTVIVRYDTSFNYSFYNFNPSGNDTVFFASLLAESRWGCWDTITKPVIVHPQPQASFVSVNDSCSPYPVNFKSTSTINPLNAIYNWYFGDGSDSLNAPLQVNHTYHNPATTPFISDTAKLVIVNKDGCTDSASQVIKVFPEVVAAFNLKKGIYSGCSPLADSIINTSLRADKYYWCLNNADTIIRYDKRMYYAFAHSYPNGADTVYHVYMKALSNYGCSDTATVPVRVFAKPQAIFGTVNPACSPYPAVMINQSNINLANAQFTWIFGDGTDTLVNDTARFMHHYYNNHATDEVISDTLQLIANNGQCADTTKQVVQVYHKPEALFTATPMEGCTDLFDTLRSQSTFAKIYTWMLDSVQYGPYFYDVLRYHIFTNSSTNGAAKDAPAWLRVESQYGCSDTSDTLFVHVKPSPKPSFRIIPKKQVFQEPYATISFDTVQPYGNWLYNWRFIPNTHKADSSASNDFTPADKSYTYWDTIHVYYTVKDVTGACVSSIYDKAYITTPRPTASFIPLTDTAGCEPFEMQFINTSLYARRYIWDFDDGDTSYQTNPVHEFIYPRRYTVTMTAIGDGGDSTYTSYVNVIAVPNVDFIMDPADGIVKLPEQEVVLTNYSNHAQDSALRYVWDFGDGLTDTNKNTRHLYNKEGIYYIKLYAYTETNPECMGVSKNVQRVDAEEVCKMYFPNVFVPDQTGPNGGRYSDVLNFSSTVFFPKHFGVEEYKLEIFNRWGELVFISRDINIGWDGWYRNNLVKQDVYIWKVQYKCSDGSEKVKVGDVTVLY